MYIYLTRAIGPVSSKVIQSGAISGLHKSAICQQIRHLVCAIVFYFKQLIDTESIAGTWSCLHGAVRHCQIQNNLAI